MGIYLVDLFCGAGGFSEGARQAGAQVVLAVDCWDAALQTHTMNHPDTHHLKLVLGGDLQETYSTLRQHIPTLAETDWLHVHASPPCQQLSRCNQYRNEEEALTLVKWTLQLLTMFSSDYHNYSWTLEEVQNKNLREMLERLGVQFKILNCNLWGVPQRRMRTFASSHIELLRTPFQTGPSTSDFLPDVVQFTCVRKDSCVRSGNEPFNTILSSARHNFRLIREGGSREAMTVDEAKILQTFPPEYKLASGPLMLRMTLVANSVPPKVSYHIIQHLIELLNQEIGHQ